MADFVTISTYDNYLAASFDKHRLEANEIDCYLADENTVTVQWTLKNALGGIKLRVPEDQAEMALSILKETRERIDVDFQIPDTEAGEICPNCGSNNTGKEKYSKSLAGWSWLVLGFPLPGTPTKHHRCFYCDHQWKS
jgi:CYTH domain-containing protein